jgi:hypothetical protein
MTPVVEAGPFKVEGKPYRLTVGKPQEKGSKS